MNASICVEKWQKKIGTTWNNMEQPGFAADVLKILMQDLNEW